MDDMTMILLGFFLVLVASVLERYCEFGRQARPDVKPRLFKTPVRWVLEALWVIALLAGGVLLLVAGIVTGLWVLALIAVIGFWLVLPFMITPIMRHRLLPHWDAVKAELEPKGYTEKNFWRGDWWMVEDKKKEKKGKLPPDVSESKPPATSVARKKDYYEILGIPRGATDEDIKQAFRKLAMEFHPDRNPGKEKWAKEKYREINQAFAVLSDPEKRKKYG